MHTRITLATVTLVALAGVGIAISGAASTTAASTAKGREYRLVGYEAWKLAVPVSGPTQQNRRPGDQRLMVQDVKTRATGRLVAHSLINCTMFRKDSLCSITFVFQNGQITGEGRVPADTNSHPFIVPVTGGSGPYQNARGQVLIENPHTVNATYETISLLP